MDQETKREIIMENYMHPINRRRSDDSYRKTNTANSSCIDNIDIYVKFKIKLKTFRSRPKGYNAI